MAQIAHRACQWLGVAEGLAEVANELGLLSLPLADVLRALLADGFVDIHDVGDLHVRIREE
jgi:hypothetical protein